MARRRNSRLLRSLVLLLLGGSLLAGAIVLAAQPRDAASSTQRALDRFADADYRGAVEAFDAALAKTPADSEAGRRRRFDLLTRRGECNLRLGRPEHALADFRESQALEPGDSLAWERVGRTLIELRRFAEATLHFDEAARTFPARERYFRYAAACAEYSVSRDLLTQGEALLEVRVRPGLGEELEHALERWSSTAERPPTRVEIEEALLEPPHRTSERDRAFEFLLESKRHFTIADQKLADYETWPELDLTFGRVRLEMHLRAGRYYELVRTAEILLRVPARPEQRMELVSVRTLHANGCHELMQWTRAAESFVALRRELVGIAAAARARGDDVAARAAMDAARRASFSALEERLRAGQAKEAQNLLEWLGNVAPQNLLHNFFAGYAQWLAGERTQCLPMLERAAQLLIEHDGRRGAFRDAEQRHFVLSRLAEALASCNRPELAAPIAGYALQDARDGAPLLKQRSELLRPFREHLPQVVADGFALLALERDHGRNLERWLEDWRTLHGRPEALQGQVTQQAERVLRSHATYAVADPALGALRPRTDDRRRSAKPSPAAIQSAGFALLQDLKREPALALLVYRELLAGGHRDQAFLLLVGLVRSHPRIADFRLRLAEHAVADGELDDAARELEALVAERPSDFEIGRLAWEVARRRGDHEGARRIVERVLEQDPGGAGRLLAAQAALADGYPGLVVGASRGVGLDTPEERALAGLRSRALLALGDETSAGSTANAVLGADPAERSAAITRLTLLARSADETGARRSDAFVAEHADELRRLAPSQLVELAHAAFDEGAFDSALALLDLSDAAAPERSVASLLRADALYALGRYDEVEPVLEPLLASHARLEAIRRTALVRLARDGAEAAWQFLRDRLAAGVPESELARWLVLIGCASGRHHAALDLLQRRSLPLEELAERFVALTCLVYAADVPQQSLPASLAARLRLPMDRSTPRDRELERWVSLDLASPQHRFVEAMLRLLLLADLPSFAPLLEQEQTRLLERFPSIGFLARARAAALDEAARPAEAAALLVRQIELDPGDLASLAQVALYADDLDPATLARLVEIAAASGLDPAHRALLAARTELAAGRSGEALRLFQLAAGDPRARAAALVAIARTQKRKLLPEIDLGRAPWCEAVLQARALDLSRGAERTIVEAAQRLGDDPVVLRAVARRLRDDGARMDPEARRLLITALITQPGPWYDAHELAIAEAASAGADVATLEALGRVLEAAIAAGEPGPPPVAAIRAFTRLASAARAKGATELADGWLATAHASCPHDPDVLAARARVALDRDDVALAARLFDRAILFGAADPEVHVWIGEHALIARADLASAAARAARALELATAPTDADLRARAQETIARASFLSGDFNGARTASVAACKERGEDPRLSLHLALEAFARIPPEPALARLEPLTQVAGPTQALVQRLAELCREEIAAKRARAEQP